MTKKLESAPHGGVLINREVSSEARGEAQARASRLPVVNLNARAASDLLLLATGAFSPLEGFMGHDAARSAAENLTLPDGLLWPLPVLLQLEASQAATNKLVILTPYVRPMPYQVAATAWTQLLGCPTYNDRVPDAMRAFRDQYRLKGPEYIPNAE